MSYTTAVIIVWSHRSYSNELVQKAATLIIDAPNAKADDLARAYGVR